MKKPVKHTEVIDGPHIQELLENPAIGLFVQYSAPKAGHSILHTRVIQMIRYAALMLRDTATHVHYYTNHGSPSFPVYWFLQYL